MEASSGSGYLISGRPLALISVLIVFADTIARQYFHRIQRRRQLNVQIPAEYLCAHSRCYKTTQLQELAR